MVYSECKALSMKNYNNIQIEIKKNSAYLILNRPKQHNALNPDLIAELNEAFIDLNLNTSIQFILLSGNGKSFCAGADINWFSDAINKIEKENLKEYKDLANLLLQIYQSPKITIAAVHKNVFGGANGLIAACDFVVATEKTTFSFSEVKLGIIPATILPFVAKRLSTQQLKQLMLTGKKISTDKALQIGLVDYMVEEHELMSKVEELISDLELGGPNAVSKCKALIHDVDEGRVTVNDSEITAKMLSKIVLSDEGREGTQAFLEKRVPNWIEADIKN